MKTNSFIRILGFLLVGIGAAALFMSKGNFHESKKKSGRILLEERPFVVIIPSFNNSAYCEQNLLSVLTQNYKNFRVIYIDDASGDDTLIKISELIDRSLLKQKVMLVHNTENQGALKNLYTAIHSCEDHEIAVLVDGDDFLAHPNVLKKLNSVYADGSTWMTYGNYLDYPSYKQKPTICKKIPHGVIERNSFRSYKWVSSHLRTFYVGLFKKIAKEDLLFQGQFLPMGWDLAVMLPLLEMSGPHCQFIKEPLYLYNRLNPLNDHKRDLNLQGLCAAHIKAKPPYPRLVKAPYFLKHKEADIVNSSSINLTLNTHE